MEYKENQRNFYECLYGSSSVFGLCDHVRLHHVSIKNILFACDSDIRQIYMCRSCDFKTNLQVLLQNHINMVHKVLGEFATLRSYRCENCDFRTYSLLILARHVCRRQIKGERATSQSAKWFECEQCLFKTKTKFSLKRHVLTQHLNPEDIEWYDCYLCPFRTKQKFHLKLHVLVKHRPSKRIKKAKRRPPRRPKPQDEWFRCELCPYKTKRRFYDLKRHVVAKHEGRGDAKWFECYQCSYRTKLKLELSAHALAEHKPANIKCAHCSFKAQRRRDLREHMREHPEYTKWFKCDHCSYRTKRKFDLKRHTATKHRDSGWHESK